MPLRAETQAKLDKLNADLRVALAKNNLADAAKILNAVGKTYFDNTAYSKALETYDNALSDANAVPDLQQQVTALNGIAGCYRAQGQVSKATESFDKAFDIASKSSDQRGQSIALSGLGTMSRMTGHNDKASEYYAQALLLARRVKDQGLEATILRRIGLDYLYSGDTQKASDLFDQALNILHNTDDRRTEALALMNIASADSFVGQQQKALDFLDRSLQIAHLTGDLSDEAQILQRIGNVYFALGEKQKALDYERQAVQIELQLGDRAGEALTQSRIADIYKDLGTLGERKKALDYYQLGLQTERQLGDRHGEVGILNGMGVVYSRLGEQQEALEYLNQALPISRQIGDRANEARTMNNIGSVYSAIGEKQKALGYFNQALPIAAYVSNHRLEARILTNLSRLEEPARPSLAIFYGKLAVNVFQQLRGNIAGLQDELQKTFLSSISDYYRYLARLLIRQGRLSEAQQVLNLLKDQEYKDYVRGETREALSSLSLTPAERSAEEDYQRSTAKVVEQGRRWSELKQDKARTPEEDKEFQQLSDSLGNASQLMNEYFARLYKLFTAGGDANRQVANISDETASLKQQIAKMPHTVALYTVVSESRYSVIVISGATMVAREYAIPDKNLYQKVAAFRQIILEPSKDPRPLAQELYKILISPIKADLDQAGAHTLIWSLDGVLRYVPFAALYDGKHYLVEDYSLASFTPVSIAHISDKPNLHGVSAAAMGISAKFDERLRPLPKVETELDSIVQDPQVKGSTGVMHGTILLNGKFTELAMEKQLEGQRAVVHIASHFVLRPGDDSQSYLLLAGKDGDAAGYHMTVASFRDNQKISLEGTELLTLSACDTGVGGSSANGREVDGLATTAQRKGAKAVISSLWQLNDNSTADIMADFYKRWVQGGGKVTKAEALRQAQLDLLLGKVTAKPDSSTPNAGTSYAQPYYWAPFTLMGNWQ